MTLRRRLVDWSLTGVLILLPALVLRASEVIGRPVVTLSGELVHSPLQGSHALREDPHRVAQQDGKSPAQGFKLR